MVVVEVREEVQDGRTAARAAEPLALSSPPERMVTGGLPENNVDKRPNRNNSIIIVLSGGKSLGQTFFLQT